MSCEHCVNHVKEALLELNGVSNVEVDLEDKLAIIDLAQDVDNEDIEFAIDDVGYTVLSIEEI